MIIKITKIDKVRDSLTDFGGSSPFHIGHFIKNPEIGERFQLLGVSPDPGEQGISTSLVEEIINENTFKTRNSIYHWEKLIK
jgi:hypothetical protein